MSEDFLVWLFVAPFAAVAWVACVYMIIMLVLSLWDGVTKR